MFLICFDVDSSFKCLVVYLQKQGDIRKEGMIGGKEERKDRREKAGLT